MNIQRVSVYNNQRNNQIQKQNSSQPAFGLTSMGFYSKASDLLLNYWTRIFSAGGSENKLIRYYRHPGFLIDCDQSGKLKIFYKKREVNGFPLDIVDFFKTKHFPENPEDYLKMLEQK